jgi:hypothetical protein
MGMEVSDPDISINQDLQLWILKLPLLGTCEIACKDISCSGFIVSLG